MPGPTGRYSITMPRGLTEAARARGGPSGPSACVTAAVARRIERDALDELITVAEAEHGPIGEEEVQALRDRLHQAHGRQGWSGVNTA
ncbi:CopG family transcriptional regulator [Streptomyces sp. NPDC046887]|uniref:CopG family transcriptional regulator n=1 Tax=Streptomyces sp. NPDC046887 TaxID=3155472 RepID=UPI0033F8214A